MSLSECKSAHARVFMSQENNNKTHIKTKTKTFMVIAPKKHSKLASALQGSKDRKAHGNRPGKNVKHAHEKGHIGRGQCGNTPLVTRQVTPPWSRDCLGSVALKLPCLCVSVGVCVCVIICLYG